MAANKNERLVNLLPTISKRLAGKTTLLVAKMKTDKLINESDFPNDVNPPDRVLKILAESGNSEMLERLICTLKREGLEDIVREIEGRNTQTEDLIDVASSLADEASDSFHNDSKDKLQTQGPTQGSDKINMESISRNVEEMRKDINEGLGQMGEVLRHIRQIGEEFREHKEEARKREETHWEMITKIEKEKEELRQSLEKKEAAYEILERQFENLEDKYNRLCEEMTKKGTTEIALTEKNKRLEKEIQDLRQRLIDMKKSTNERGKMYSELASPRKVNRKQDAVMANPKKAINSEKSGK